MWRIRSRARGRPPHRGPVRIRALGAAAAAGLPSVPVSPPPPEPAHTHTPMPCSSPPLPPTDTADDPDDAAVAFQACAPQEALWAPSCAPRTAANVSPVAVGAGSDALFSSPPMTVIRSPACQEIVAVDLEPEVFHDVSAYWMSDGAVTSHYCTPYSNFTNVV